jgi:Rps23 Pro-64 3,4-dihydroxylase Tpa1-like proline 4-hydroxylase
MSVYPSFINHSALTEDVLSKCRNAYIAENIVSIPDTISKDEVTTILSDLAAFKWWNYAIKTSSKGVEYFTNIDDPSILHSRAMAQYDLTLKNFAYSFKRTVGNHYLTCQCVECRLVNTARDSQVTDILSKIVGHPTLKAEEIFISNYGKDDFINIHHDIKKGDIAVTISLTMDWDPTYGGVLHFADKDKNIYKSISPMFGTMSIFRVSRDTGIDHFVSSVNVNKNRYMIVAWYSFV